MGGLLVVFCGALVGWLSFRNDADALGNRSARLVGGFGIRDCSVPKVVDLDVIVVNGNGGCFPGLSSNGQGKVGDPAGALVAVKCGRDHLAGIDYGIGGCHALGHCGRIREKRGDFTNKGLGLFIHRSWWFLW